MELVIVWDTGGTESSMAYLGEHQTYDLGSNPIKVLFSVYYVWLI